MHMNSKVLLRWLGLATKYPGYTGLHLPLILPLQERAAGLSMSDRPDNRARGPVHCRSSTLQQGQRAQEPPRVRQGLHQI